MKKMTDKTNELKKHNDLLYNDFIKLTQILYNL